MPTYHYLCDKCEYEETIEQPMGSEKTHTCPECGEGTCNRQLKFRNELSVGCATPGTCVQRTQENRNADYFLSNIRKKLKKDPHLDGKDRAADRHWAHKNKVLPGNKGEQI